VAPPTRRSRSDAALEAALERADPFMAWLGVIFALLIGYELAVPLGPTASQWVSGVGLAIWAVFVAEFLLNLWTAEHRLRFIRRQWIQVLALLVPTLRMLRFVRLLRLGRALPAARAISSSYRAAGSARRLLQSRLGYLAAVSVAVAVAVAELAYLFERDEPEGRFTSFLDAILWSFSVVIAMQGDPAPVNPIARIVMLIGYVWGLVVIGTVAASVGSFLVDARREPHDETPTV
jgi:voltage-gated potassium channel